MPNLTISAASLRAIKDSEEIGIQITEAVGCDGTDCNQAYFDENGEMMELSPHYHLIVRGTQPESGPRIYAIGGELPGEVYESQHR